jgi:hypothetical protein
MLTGILLLAVFSCNTNRDINSRQTALFTSLGSKETGVDFINRLNDNADMNIFSYRSYYNGGGVAIGDLNNDGLNDIFLTSNQGDNKLYINKGNWKFEDITEKAGVKGTKFWSTGVTLADINADGWLDIYVCNSGNIQGDGKENELFINQQNGTFKEEAAAYGLADKGLSTHAVFFDYDLDGDLDCYVLNNSFRTSENYNVGKNARFQQDEMGGDRLYRNDNNHFTDVSKEAGIYSSDIGFGLGVSVADLNNDGYPDIYISNDFFEKDYLYINQQNGTFIESIEAMTGHISLSSMGSDIADINNDGFYDIFTTEMVPEDDKRYKLITSFESYDNFKKKQQEGYFNQYMQNCLQLNNGNNTFSEIAFYSGVPATDWSWGALIFDMDNDGWKDIFVSNGIYKDLTNQDYIDFLSSEDNLRRITESKSPDHDTYIQKMTSSPVVNYAFLNNRNITFSNKAALLGLDQPSFSNGAAYGDLDNDGDNDLVINNVNMPLFVYRNNAEKTGNHYLQLQLEGNVQNKFAIGTTIRLFVNDSMIVYYHQPDHGYQSCTSPNTITIGTGSYSSIDSIQLVWPDGHYSSYYNVATDSLYRYTYSAQKEKYHYNATTPRPLFMEVQDGLFDSTPFHKEDPYVDYNRERLTPQTASAENPFMAAGDVNNDGLTDLYYGNAKGTPAKLYIQTAQGKFKEYIPDDFAQRAYIENAGAVFGDFDNDGDQDLIIAYGGNELKEGSVDLRPAYFENDGKGNFKLVSSRFLPVSINASVVRANDFDKDGDLDLFIGGRSVPGSYGSTPSSYIFQNDGKGNFTDITERMPGGNLNVGMVTDAQWADLDKNGYDDLIITGHWMGILIYKNDKGIFSRNESLEKYKGWWNSISVNDVDGDGYPDIIAGNLGLNSKFSASATEPMKLFVKDFDGNGSKESIISLFKSDHKEYVFHQRRDLADQIITFKKQFLKYADYAGKPLNEVFPEAVLKDADKKEITILESVVFMNKEAMNFNCHILPFPAQLSSVNAILCDDLNKDGKKEIILTGNFLHFKPEIGRLDAAYGQVYQWEKDHFEYIPALKTGLVIKGAVRSSLIIHNVKGQKYLLFGRNNSSMKVYKPVN